MDLRLEHRAHVSRVDPEQRHVVVGSRVRRRGVPWRGHDLAGLYRSALLLGGSVSPAKLRSPRAKRAKVRPKNE